ncbi:hypothetical protein L218DRAFT_521852 [Marasmius fiardii PR-910]|nr:hypothetical protein L218DRAFT_521852 [Marasmius fiardii PR-910]
MLDSFESIDPDVTDPTVNEEEELAIMEDGLDQDRVETISSNLEEIAIDFLSQLCRDRKNDNLSSRESSAEISEDTKPAITIRPRVQLRLLNRLKRTSSGEYSTKHLKFPRKSSSGSAKPFGN